MLAHSSGMMGLPLRLLAREVYERVRKAKGASEVALITGEEKILPPHARYFICTVEAMPLEREVAFMAIDEIQLATDRERGHVFTDRLLHARGRDETMVLGSETVRGLIQKLLPDTVFVSRPRFSELTWSGSKKITKLPRRSAIVAFSADQVYAVAELIRRQRGGAAVVMGALSPRTRNAQVALYQSGDVDFLVATDAIGMGLNMDVDHVAFASTSKFDGSEHRPLRVSELAQIAGRAGRHMNNGTFGVTGEASGLPDDTIERIENHHFEAERVLLWRNPNLDFSSLDGLIRSLEVAPSRPGLTRAPMGIDHDALARLKLDPDIRALARGPAALKKLWEVAQIPDFRKTMTSEHVSLLNRLYRFLMHENEHIPEEWLAEQVSKVDRTDGDIDTLAARIAHVRTWTFIANRSGWLDKPLHWQERTRAIEDKLSDALHERLTQRFVDRRTSILMKRLRQKEDLMAAVNKDGDVLVEGEFVGKLQGFVFVADPKAEGVHGKALREASAQALAGELMERAQRLFVATDADIQLSENGRLIWDGHPVAELVKADSPFSPRIELIAGEELQNPHREAVRERLEKWLTQHIATVLAPLFALRDAEEVVGLARGIAFRMLEGYGSLRRENVAEDVRVLDQAARGQLRKHGVRFGAYSIFMPALLKPAPARLLLALWSLSRDGADEGTALPQPPSPGLTSVPADKDAPQGFYEALGFRVCGTRAVRIDMLERLANLIRPVIMDRIYQGGFVVTPDMMSLVGCSGEEFAGLLRGLGYRSQLETVRVKTLKSDVVVAAPSADEADAGATHGDAAPETAEAGADVDAVQAAVETLSSEEAPVDTGAGAEPVAAVAVEPVQTDAAAVNAADEEAAGSEAALAEPVAEGHGEASTQAQAQATSQNAPAVTGGMFELSDPVELEIWRPQRRQQPSRRHQQGGEKRQPRAAAPARTGEDATAERTQPAGGRGERRGGERSERAPEEGRGRREQGRDFKSGKPSGKGGGKPQGKPGRDEGRNDRPRGDGGYKDSKPREKPFDPDSPFAALAVLRDRVGKP